MSLSYLSGSGKPIKPVCCFCKKMVMKENSLFPWVYIISFCFVRRLYLLLFTKLEYINWLQREFSFLTNCWERISIEIDKAWNVPNFGTQYLNENLVCILYGSRLCRRSLNKWRHSCFTGFSRLQVYNELVTLHLEITRYCWARQVSVSYVFEHSSTFLHV